jgi:Co/Zn/Cd efflux system component
MIIKSSNKSNIMVKVVINMLLLFLIASGSVFIHYGNKIKDKQINEDDNKAGQFMMVLGIIGLLANFVASVMLGYYWDSELFTTLEKMLQIITILFTLASNVILIIYGFKIEKNNITTDDYKAGEFIVTLGALSVVSGSIGFLYFSGLFTMVMSSKKKKTRS